MCLAIPGKVISLSEELPHSALIEVVGVRRRVDISLVEPDGIVPGDWVLIHVGFAMSRIDEAEAAETLRILTELGEAQQELDAMRHSAAE